MLDAGEVPMSPIFEAPDDGDLYTVERSESTVPERSVSRVPDRTERTDKRNVMFDPTSTRKPNPLMQSCCKRCESKECQDKPE
jgi:hypothetical protein